MKKRSFLIWLLIVGVVLISILSLILFARIELDDGFTSITGAEYFLNSDYAEYIGGEEAKMFFDMYSSTSDYKNIAFEYHKGGIVGNYAPTFILDLQYVPEQYTEIKNGILSRFSPELELDTFSYDGFVINLVTLNEDLYNDNFCLICFDDDYHIARFIVIHNISPKDYDVYSPIGDNTINLKWNKDENDLVFPE